MALLSGLVPTVAVVSGRSFAGNARIAGMSDVVFATRGSAIGIGGPPLVEAALGVSITPEELGPSEMHERNGGIDLLIGTDAEGADLVRRYLAYFIVARTDGTTSPTHDTIRSIVPDNRRGLYDMRKVVRALADADSVFELRPAWATAAITALARMGGHTVAIIANQPLSPIAGAIDSDAADKLARFIRLADAYDIPIVSLMDYPGFMLGPDAERAGIARHHARPLMAQVHRTVPLFLVHIRKAYGLGPMAMGGMFQPTDLRLAWPTVEAGGMALEGAAALIQRREVEVPDESAGTARERRDELAAKMREGSLAISAARRYAYDEVIDPAETRERIVRMLDLLPAAPARSSKKHYIDTW
jgi:acetyl-CoA carboxylase carboxyltransferase component